MHSTALSDVMQGMGAPIAKAGKLRLGAAAGQETARMEPTREHIDPLKALRARKGTCALPLHERTGVGENGWDLGLRSLRLQYIVSCQRWKHLSTHAVF